jgi:PAS domain S-box-containing protein
MSRKIGLSGGGLAGGRFLGALHEVSKGSDEQVLSKWKQLFEHAACGIVLLGAPGISMRAVNPAYARMHGYTVEELTGRPLAVTLSPEARANLERNLETADKNGHYISESVHVRKDGTIFPALIDFTAVKDDGGNVLLRWENTQDITDQKRLEQRLRKKQKLESLGVLAGGLAHDFNNLLTGIIGNASLALNMQPADSPARAKLADVIRASEEAADLTRKILAYSGKGGFVIRPLNLSEEVRGVTEILRASVARNVRLELDLSGDTLPVHADPSQIQQLIINLVVNGAEAIGEQQGTVWVKTGTETIGEDVIADDFSGGDPRPGRYACLEVRDTGCGMVENMVTRIFDPFFTTKFTGRGLGLAAVSGIVRSLQGAIKVQSKLGEGSTFRVFLPVAEAQSGRQQGVPQL